MLLQENDFSEIKKKVIIRGNDSRPKKYSAWEFLRLIGSVVRRQRRRLTMLTTRLLSQKKSIDYHEAK